MLPACASGPPQGDHPFDAFLSYTILQLSRNVSAIFGIYGQHARDDVPRMGERLQHRGPRVAIRTIGDNLTVGAIGRDPEGMIFAAADAVVVTDATVYDRQNLADGFDDSVKPPASTAELLHRLVLGATPARLDTINGDFAIAVVDLQSSAISLARDFFGSHPLYVCGLDRGGVAFASEYKALLAVMGRSATVDLDMVQYLQCTKRLPVGRTLFKEIVEVPPGAISTWDGNDGLLRLRYAIPPVQVDVTVRDESRAIELIQRNLRESLRVRVDDLDTIGLALSGGIDSISLAFLLRELRPNGVIHTFTAGSDRDDHELITAAKVASAIGSVHHEVLTPPGLLKDRLSSLVWHLEDPLSRSEALQLFEVGRAAAGTVDVLFTAQGADGLFAGMPKYRLLWLADRFPMFRRGLEEFYNLTQAGIKPVTPIGKLFDYLKYRGQVPRVPRVDGAAQPAPGAFPEPGPELVNRAAARGLQAGVCQDLHKFDRGFSAFGIEARFPFYDMRLVRTAFTITDRLKIRGNTQKYIFRKAMENIVPDDFRQLSKFPMRMRYDLAFAGILDEIGKELLLRDGGARDRGLFDRSSLQNIFRQSPQTAYRDEAAMRIWSAVTTEIWFRLFVDESAENAYSPASRPVAGMA